MKKIIILIIIILSVNLNGQSKTFTYSLNGITTIQIETNTTTDITAGKSNQLIITEKKHQHDNDEDHCGDCDHDTDHDDNHKKSFEDKTKGLTAIYPGGKDNTNGLGFGIRKEGNVLFITDLKNHFNRNNLLFTFPKNINIIVNTGNLGSLNISGFSSEVEAKTVTGNIRMKDVTGPITAHSNVGKVLVEFSKVKQGSPISISSSTSEIDVTMPANTKANLELKTNGTVYTNFDVQMPTKDGLKNVGGRQKIISTLNNGGVQIKLKSSLGNIYLRKK